MPLEYNELEPIIAETIEKVRADIIRANMMGTLDLVLEKYGVDAALPDYGTKQRSGDTILVLGALSIGKDDLNNLFRRFKVKERCFEFVEYDDVTNFNFAKLIANTKYSDVFVGPVPHKAMNIGDASSVIEYLQSSNEIPAKVAVLRDVGGELKMSKKRSTRNSAPKQELLPTV